MFVVFPRSRIPREPRAPANIKSVICDGNLTQANDAWVGHLPVKFWLAVFDTRNVRRYLTRMRTTISSKGQIVLPAEFREMDRVEPGQEFDVERLEHGDYRLVRRAAPRNSGAIDWLLACPHKDFFVPIDSESTDTL